jgi:hypothetical protein
LSEDADPKRPGGNCNHSECSDSHETDRDCGHQTLRASQHKPEQRSKDLASVQGIDRQHVEDEQTDVDEHQHLEQCIQVGRRFRKTSVEPEQ